MTKRAGSRGFARVFAGFVVGVVTGLVIAAIAALFITRAPVPFVNKVLRPGERAAEPKAGAELPDPNRPLQRKRADAAPDAAPAATPAPAEGAPASPGVLDRLFGGTPATPATPAPAPGDGASRAGEIGRAGDAPRPSAPAPAAAPESAGRPGAAEDRSSFFLQAGAFRSQEDADSMKGRLALIGLEARVSAVEVNGQTLYRVRVGPFAQMDDVNKVRTRLAENGIEASVMRQK